MDCPMKGSFPEFIEEQENQIGNFNRQQFNPFSDKYNLGWRHHPNFVWKNNQQNQVNPSPLFQNNEAKKSSMKDMMAQLAQTTNTLTQNTNNFMQATQTSLQNQQASIRKLEDQVGQIAHAMVEREKGKFPSQTEINMRNMEQLKAITLRSGRTVEKNGEDNGTLVEKSENAVTEVQEGFMNSVAQVSNIVSHASDSTHLGNLILEKANVAPVPYPQRLHKAKKDQNFSHILELFKKVNINIPLLDAVKQIPSYAKFLKDAYTNKRRFLEHEKVMLSEECSAILQKKLPLKLTDPGSFMIPCTIGKSSFEKALCDLSASIKLMPYSIFKQLGLGEMKPTLVSLQLTDRSITYPRGIVEDVLVRVDQLILPADFLILDMEEDREIPIILGRPFLATAGTLIDVKCGVLTLRVEDRKVVFKVFEATKHPREQEECFSIDILNQIMSEQFQAQFWPIPRVEVEEVTDIVNILNSGPLHNLRWRHHYEALGPAPVKIYPSVEVAPKLDLKQLLTHMRYAFLGASESLLVIIVAKLTYLEEEELFRVLRDYKTTLG
ncbi:uncharacterized protein [Pyrus communis]|uniref:uncharacterized protein n=1 Tax=Pyrus communis TaxID=23211 RepID=UPI0035BF725C